MNVSIKKFPIEKNFSAREISKLPSIKNISPIKEYSAKKYSYDCNTKILSNSLFKSNIKYRNKQNSFLLSNKSKKISINDYSKININKTNNFSSANIKNENKIKVNFNINNNNINNSLQLRNKTFFQKIIDNINNLQQNNVKIGDIIKKNARKSFSLRLINYTNWKKFKIKKISEKSKQKPHKETEKNNKDNKDINKNQTNENKPEQITSDNQNDEEKITKEMYHHRNLFISREKIEINLEKADIINKLTKKNIFIKNSDLQMNDILNKIKLIFDNIDDFKVNYFNNGNFYSAFDNMENLTKAEFNLTLEEICFLLIELCPILLRKYYENRDMILYVPLPDFKKEMEKDPKNEKECLELNSNLLNSVSTYFMGCAEVLEEIKKKINDYKFNKKEFYTISNYLDLARYDISKINSMAEIYIDKMHRDREILEKLEMGLGIKPKKKFLIEDIFERNHKRYKQNFKETMKYERINATLNLKRAMSYSSGNEKRNKFILMRRSKNLNILNRPVVTAMMKYFKDSIKSQIISQQVFERFKSKEKQAQRAVISNNN